MKKIKYIEKRIYLKMNNNHFLNKYIKIRNLHNDKVKYEKCKHII